MLVTKNATTSIRIQQEFKQRLGKIAKSQKTNFTKLLSSILDEYLKKEELKSKVVAFKKLQSEVQKIETWTAKEELIELDKNRKNNSYRLK